MIGEKLTNGKRFISIYTIFVFLFRNYRTNSLNQILFLLLHCETALASLFVAKFTCFKFVANTEQENGIIGLGILFPIFLMFLFKYIWYFFSTSVIFVLIIVVVTKL